MKLKQFGFVGISLVCGCHYQTKTDDDSDTLHILLRVYRKTYTWWLCRISGKDRFQKLIAQTRGSELPEKFYIRKKVWNKLIKSKLAMNATSNYKDDGLNNYAYNFQLSLVSHQQSDSWKQNDLMTGKVDQNWLKDSIKFVFKYIKLVSIKLFSVAILRRTILKFFFTLIYTIFIIINEKY